MSSTCSTNRETGRDQFSASQAAAEGPAASCSNTLAPAGAGAAAGRLGQHPGALAAAVADAYRAFGAQGAAQQEQHLCRQLFPNGAPEDPTVGKGGGPRKGTGGQAGAQPHPVAHHPAGPDPGPLQQDRVPAGCGPFAQHRAFVEDGSGMDTGILAQNGAVKCGAVARRCAVEHAALDQRALAHGASPRPTLRGGR